MCANTTKPDSFGELKIKFSAAQSAGHTLFLKEHVVRKQETNENCTLLVLNIPPYCDEKCLRRLFGACGKILNVHEQKNPGNFINKSCESTFFPSPPIKGFHVAYITFQLENSIGRVMKMAKELTEPICLSTLEHEIPTGIKKWCLEYLSTWPDTKKLQEEIDSYMEVYDAKVAEEEQKAIENEGVPDEDGWVKVTRLGRNPGLSRTESNELRAKSNLKRKRKEQESLKFYSHQIRESKREQIAQLRRGFEEDKSKIEAMKKARKFKPFK